MQERTLDSIPAPALRLDRTRCVVEANKAATRLFQLEREQMVGKPVGSLEPPASAEVPVEDTPGEIELADGTTILIYPAIALQQRMQQEIYHLSRLASVGKLVTTVVHEINNSLSGILGYTQLALQSAQTEAVSADLQRAYESALRTSQVVQNLLRFSRQGERKKTGIDLAALLQRCGEMKRRDFALRSIGFELSCPADLPLIEGDEALLFQVFINLLSNAEQSIRAHQEIGKIQVYTRRLRDTVRIEFRDDGPGIPEDKAERIFDPFYSSRLGKGGTGLGLTLCREILTDHGGSIQLLRSVKEGAAFRITLPVAPAQLARHATETSQKRAVVVRDRRIVVIEDEAFMRDVMERAFSGNGNQTVTFERGEEALAYLRREPVDLIISDIHRPGLNGIALYHKLSRSRPELRQRFLFITGDTLGEKTAAFLRRTHVPCLAKPILIPDLLEKSREILDRPVEQRELFQ